MAKNKAVECEMTLAQWENVDDATKANLMLVEIHAHNGRCIVTSVPR